MLTVSMVNPFWIALSEFSYVYVRYNDDVLSISNPNYADWIPLRYPNEFEIKKLIETPYSSSNRDNYLTNHVENT